MGPGGGRRAGQGGVASFGSPSPGGQWRGARRAAEEQQDAAGRFGGLVVPTDGPGDEARPRAGRRAAPEPAPGAGADLPGRRPGDVTQDRITFWDDEAIGAYRSEWHELKAQFVDDPVAALTRAHHLLTEAVHELSEALLAERDDLDPLRRTSAPDTESMRMAMQGYKEFLDRILTL
jgi:hypothetical protein